MASSALVRDSIGSFFHVLYRQPSESKYSFSRFGGGNKTAVMAEAGSLDPRRHFQIAPAQPRPSRRKVGAQLEPFLRAANSRQAPIGLARMNHEQEVIGTCLHDGRTKRHAHRQLENTAIPGGRNRLQNQGFSA